jgi:hypothetical protein
MSDWQKVAPEKEPDDFDKAVSALMELLSHVLSNNIPIGIDGVLDMREDTAFVMRFNHNMDDPNERADACALIKSNNDIFATIRIIKKNRAARKKAAQGKQ